VHFGTVIVLMVIVEHTAKMSDLSPKFLWCVQIEIVFF
jgi:hypothetical protein